VDSIKRTEGVTRRLSAILHATTIYIKLRNDQDLSDTMNEKIKEMRDEIAELRL
jgi:hypothetical protein